MCDMRLCVQDRFKIQLRGRAHTPFILVGSLMNNDMLITYSILYFEENGTIHPSIYKLTEYEHPGN